MSKENGFPQMQPPPAPAVLDLLQGRFDELERLFESDPYDEAIAAALTIKEFILDRGGRDLEQGVRSFLLFKEEQAAALAALGFCPAQAKRPLPSTVALQPASERGLVPLPGR